MVLHLIDYGLMVYGLVISGEYLVSIIVVVVVERSIHNREYGPVFELHLIVQMFNECVVQ